MEREIYILSGLGADERVFQNLDFSGFQPNFVKWIPPRKNESIENYSIRLSKQITSPKPILIGLSFGGMMAVEMAKLIETKKVILIASAKNKSEIPFYYRVAGFLRLHQFLPAKLLKSSNFAVNYFFGAKSAFDKQLLKQILHDTDSDFLKWSINAIVNWNNRTPISNLIHIHGTKDKILPIGFVDCNVKVKGGGHLMTLNQSEKLNSVLRELLIKSEKDA